MASFLQSYIFPVCTYSEKSGSAFIERCYGTGFQINSAGIGLTAKHVLDAAISDAAANSLNVGIVGKASEGTDVGSVVAPVLRYEFAPAPFDVAMFQTSYKSNTLLFIAPRQIEVWQEVATLGYPLNAIAGDPASKRLNIRAQRGHVQRIISPEDWAFGASPNSFELSFLVSRGMSGSPLFVHAQPKDILVGICVSSFRSETVDSEIVEIDRGGSRAIERIVKIEEFGVAQDIRGLSSWAPEILNGQTFAAASAYSYEA